MRSDRFGISPCGTMIHDNNDGNEQTCISKRYTYVYLEYYEHMVVE